MRSVRPLNARQSSLYADDRTGVRATFCTQSISYGQPEATLKSAMDPLRLSAANALNITRELLCLVDDWAGGYRDFAWSNPARQLLSAAIEFESPAAEALRNAVFKRFALHLTDVPAGAFDTVGSLVQHVFDSLC